MDSEIIYSIFGIFVFIIIIVLVMRNKEVVISRSQEEKMDEVISNYKNKLQIILGTLEGDKRVKKKEKLLGQISNELALNIYFDEDDIREAIKELSKE